MPRTIFGVALLATALAFTATGRADAAVSAPAIQDRTLFLAGDATADRLALRVSATSLQTLEIDAGDDGTVEFRVSRARFDRVVVRLGDGDDRVRVVDTGVKGAAPLPVTLEGQGGADTLSGGRAADTLDGGAGNDVFIVGAAGGNDSIDGREGFDQLAVSGTDAAEQFRAAAQGARARLTRDVGAVCARHRRRRAHRPRRAGRRRPAHRRRPHRDRRPGAAPRPRRRRRPGLPQRHRRRRLHERPPVRRRRGRAGPAGLRADRAGRGADAERPGRQRHGRGRQPRGAPEADRGRGRRRRRP